MKKIIFLIIVIITIALSAVCGLANSQIVEKKEHYPTAGNSARKIVFNTYSSFDNKRVNDLLQAAIKAMGGEAKLRALASLKIEGIGHSFALEQSERPEGPWIVSYEQVKELRDLTNRKLRRTSESRNSQVPDWSGSTLIVAGEAAAIERGGRMFPSGIAQFRDAQMQMALAPERILLTALEAADLTIGKDTTMQSVPHHVVKFTWQKIPVALYLNANTNLPTAVETLNVLPYEALWSVWGDFTTRTYFTFWTLEPGGLPYPRQLDTERNNQPFKSFTVINLKLNEPTAAESFNISEDIRKAFAARPVVRFGGIPLGRPDRPVQEIVPGIVKIPGSWDIAFVRQTDGIVIIEAPISSGYSAKVLTEATRRFPDLPVKAVISTSDAFPHIGGVREYVAQNIPIYALDLNRPILDRVIASTHLTFPDALQQKPRKANFKIVSKKTVVGTGANRLEIYPIRSESGERMVMVYFPEHKLLYGSDLVQIMPDKSFFMPQYISELTEAAERENLTVEKVFAMHAAALPWTTLTSAVEKAKAETK